MTVSFRHILPPVDQAVQMQWVKAKAKIRADLKNWTVPNISIHHVVSGTPDSNPSVDRK